MHFDHTQISPNSSQVYPPFSTHPTLSSLSLFKNPLSPTCAARTLLDTYDFPLEHSQHITGPYP